MDQPLKSYEVMNALRDGGHLRGLNKLEALVLIVIASRVQSVTCECYPSRESVAKDIGAKNVSRVGEALASLTEKGILQTVKTGTGPGHPTVRKLCCPSTELTPHASSTGYTSRPQLCNGTGDNSGTQLEEQPGTLLKPTGDTFGVNQVHFCDQPGTPPVPQTTLITGTTKNHVDEEAEDDIAFPNFPLKAAKGKPAIWTMPDSVPRDLKTTFPHVDIQTELRTAWLWTKDNRAKRKTASGMRKFLSGWIRRSKPKSDAGHTPGAGTDHFDFETGETRPLTPEQLAIISRPLQPEEGFPPFLTNESPTGSVFPLKAVA